MKMSDETINLLRSIDNRLKELLRLEVESHFDDGDTKKQRIAKLYKMGFDNAEMAEIVNSSEGSVRGTISTLRKEGVIDE